MERPRLGDHVYVNFVNKSRAGDVMDCDTGYPLLEWEDPAGKILVASTDVMTNQATGDYYYNAATATTSPSGVFKANIICITDSITTQFSMTYEVL